MNRVSVITRHLCTVERSRSGHHAQKGVALIMGTGDGTGAAIARRFAREDYIACLVRRDGKKLEPIVNDIRTSGGEAYGFGADGRQPEQVASLISSIEKQLGPIQIAIHNIGANVRFGVLETTPRVYSKVWDMACFSGFLLAREAARVMMPRKQGSIFFTGATAAVRGTAGFSAFSGAKHGLRGLAQCLTQEMEPHGIHVAHVLVDGAIDMPWIRQNFPESEEKAKVEGLVKPDSIAEAYFMLHQQPRSAWTHELDLRPWIEKW